MYVEILTPTDDIVSEGGAFGRCLKHGGGAFWNGISVITKRLQRAPCPGPACEDTLRSPSMNQEEGPHPDYAGGFILDSPASRTGREKFLLLLSYPVSVIVLEWMQTLTFLCLGEDKEQ